MRGAKNTTTAAVAAIMALLALQSLDILYPAVIINYIDSVESFQHQQQGINYQYRQQQQQQQQSAWSSLCAISSRKKANRKASTANSKIKIKTNNNNNNNNIKPTIKIKSASSASSLIGTLQAECHSPSLLLSKVGSKLSPASDPDGRVSSLVLIRLAKLAVERANQQLYCSTNSNSSTNIENPALTLWDDNDNDNDAIDIDIDPTVALLTLANVCSTLAVAIASSKANLDSGVEGIKAAGVLSRFVTINYHDDDNMLNADAIFLPLMTSYENVSVDEMEEHHLSGLRWAFDNLSLCCGNNNNNNNHTTNKNHNRATNNNNANNDLLPAHISTAYQHLHLPFRIRPNLLQNIPNLTVSALTSQVQFNAETIHTTSTSKTVQERRLTAWEAQSTSIPGFAYSGKIMETRQFSPLVLAVRDALMETTKEWYDCCLLNLYTDGESGMRYHVDPDQGVLWGYETVVVSVGAARKFSFRDIIIDEKEKEMNGSNDDDDDDNNNKFR